jgi:hypothetical protein
MTAHACNRPPHHLPEDVHTLDQWSRSGAIRATSSSATNPSAGLPRHVHSEIANRVGCSRPTIILWRHCYIKASLTACSTSLAQVDPDRLHRRRAEILTPPLVTGSWADELAAALRTLPNALNREQATSAATDTAVVEPHARASAGRDDCPLADRFVANSPGGGVEVLAVLCRNAPN